jgi:hypothetical protein
MTTDDVPQWQDDMVRALRRIAAAVDPPPDGLLPAARAAFLARDLDAQIALLIADSRAMSGAAVYEPVRAEPEAAPGRWLLSFEGGGIAVELEVELEVGGGRLRLLGLLSGAAVEDCYLESGGDQRRVEVDDLGRFMLDGVAHGRLRLRCRSSDGARVTTAWVAV